MRREKNLNWLPNGNKKIRRRSKTLQGSQRMGGGKNSLKISGPRKLIKIYQIRPLYHRERILETSTLSCNKEEEEITKPPKR
jgi:hypothetical protein